MDAIAHTMRTTHHVDGQELKLSVVAVKRTPGAASAAASEGGPMGSMYLVLRIIGGPSGGRPGLLEYLGSAPTKRSGASSMQSTIRQALAVHRLSGSVPQA